MTGEEYRSLWDGDECILLEDIETHNLKWSKEDIIKVEYINRFEETVYFSNKNVQYKDRPSYKALSVLFCLKAIAVYRKFSKGSVTKTAFEHKFNVGDTVWRMNYNKPESHKISMLTYYDDNKGKPIIDYECEDGLVLDDKCGIYGSKDELLDSLR